MVAPCAGAWIETGGVNRMMAYDKVAPCAGAWIETREIWIGCAI